jgi:hypothetical protein
MKRGLLRIEMVLRITAWTFLIFFLLIITNAILQPKFPVHLALPNGSIIFRSFEIRQVRAEPSLYAKDGKTLLAKNIEFICFNDHYVKVSSYDRGGGGIFGAQTELSSPNLDYLETLAISGLGGNRKGCNGYFTAIIGPTFFFEGNDWPFLPSCEYRNFENLALQDRSWFDRPCANEFQPRLSNRATAH